MRFVCSECGHSEPATTRKPCCDCGGLWDLDFSAPKFDAKLIDRAEPSLFRYRAFMAPVGEAWRDVSLGEGLTPVIRYDDDVLLKLDYCMPTLSYKDRGAAVLVAHCAAVGVKSVVQDSSGNAGNSIAAYCARAGIACKIFVPERTSPAKVAMIRAHGAEVRIVPGSRDHCADACRDEVFRQGAYYASHVYNPLFYQGTKTYIYEVYEQLGRIPATIVVPVGNGTLFLGVVYALEELLRSGAINAMPHILAVQSERCAPLLRAAEASLTDPADVMPEPTAAEGIAIGRPMRGREILRLARKHGVRFIAAPEGGILSARAALARNGLYVEPTTAACYAAYLSACRACGPLHDALIPLTGAGLKADH